MKSIKSARSFLTGQSSHDQRQNFDFGCITMKLRIFCRCCANCELKLPKSAAPTDLLYSIVIAMETRNKNESKYFWPKNKNCKQRYLMQLTLYRTFPAHFQGYVKVKLSKIRIRNNLTMSQTIPDSRASSSPTWAALHFVKVASKFSYFFHSYTKSYKIKVHTYF